MNQPTSIPKVSMNPRHHYVTQSSIYDNPILGPLTDRKIAVYQREKLKRMGITISTKQKPQPKVKKPKQPKKLTALERLFAP